MYPSADTMARIIVAACQETGAYPLAIDVGMSVPIRMARAYSALAVRELFPNCKPIAIGRMVGAGSPSVYPHQLWARMAKGGVRGFDQDALDRVIAAGRADDAGESPDAPTAAAARPSAPEFTASDFVRVGSKRDLERILREAVENTAKLQRG